MLQKKTTYPWWHPVFYQVWTDPEKPWELQPSHLIQMAQKGQGLAHGINHKKNQRSSQCSASLQLRDKWGQYPGWGIIGVLLLFKKNTLLARSGPQQALASTATLCCKWGEHLSSLRRPLPPSILGRSNGRWDTNQLTPELQCRGGPSRAADVL